MQGLITLNNPNYEPEQWHGTLLVIAAVAIAIAINIFLSKTLPIAEWFILVLHVVGLFAIIIPLLAMAPKNSARVALLDITNNGGWSTRGTSFMVGLLTVLGSMMGFDCAVHMCKPSIRDGCRVAADETQLKRFKTHQKHSLRPFYGALALTQS